MCTYTFSTKLGIFRFAEEKEIQDKKIKKLNANKNKMKVSTFSVSNFLILIFLRIHMC